MLRENIIDFHRNLGGLLHLKRVEDGLSHVILK
jgi:hypothetical protein